MNDVRDRLGQWSHEELSQILEDYEGGWIGVRSVFRKAYELLADHPLHLCQLYDCLPTLEATELPSMDPQHHFFYRFFRGGCLVFTDPRVPIDFENSLSFIKLARATLVDRQPVYKALIDFLKEIQTSGRSVAEVHAGLVLLLQGHPELVVGVNFFLPPGIRIELPPEDHVIAQKKVRDLKDAIRFKNLVKNHGQVYNSFKEILKRYADRRIQIHEVNQEISELFDGRANLLRQFSNISLDALSNSLDLADDVRHALPFYF